MGVVAPQKVQCDVTEHREGLRPLVFANPARLLIKGHIEHPMSRVLDAPMLPHRLGEAHPVGRKRR